MSVEVSASTPLWCSHPRSAISTASCFPISRMTLSAHMHRIPLFLLCALIFGCGQTSPLNPQAHYQRAMDELTKAKTPMERFYALGHAAKESFVAGKIEDAQKYAQELLTALPKYQGNWNYGNAVQDANLVLGRIAVREGLIEDAKKYLAESGKSPGSPQMNSFGPNMSLAKDLLEKGERQAVLDHFEACRKFWEMHRGQLDEWSQQVKDGKIPDFGANLIF